MDAPLLPSGNAFNGSYINSNRLETNLSKSKNKVLVNQEKTNYVSLTEWCNKNFISKKIGRKLIIKKLLIGQKLYGQWWVCANIDCLEKLLDYLEIQKLFFDADNK